MILHQTMMLNKAIVVRIILIGSFRKQNRHNTHKNNNIKLYATGQSWTHPTNISRPYSYIPYVVIAPLGGMLLVYEHNTRGRVVPKGECL